MVADSNKWMPHAMRIAELVQEKNAAYGDSFARCGEIIKVLYPNGVSHDQLEDMLTMVRVLDKMFRIASRKDAFGESPADDLVGYWLLAAERQASKRGC